MTSNDSFHSVNDFFPVRDEEEADIIASQYEKAMARDHTYVCDSLAFHVLQQHGYARRSTDGDYVVGTPLEGTANQERTWALSHFAPKTLRSGLIFMRDLALSGQPIVIAVPRKQARMLMHCGWELVGMTRQRFAGRLVGKFLLVNRGVNDDILGAIYDSTQDTLLDPGRLP